MLGNTYWKLGPLFGPGGAFGLATVGVPFAIAIAIYQWTSSVDLLGGYLVSTVIIAIGTVMGSTMNVTLGLAIAGLVTATENFNVGVVAAIGGALFLTMVLYDLSMVARRGSVNTEVVTGTAATTAAVIFASGAVSVAMWFVATLQTWNIFFVPAGILAIGIVVQVGGRLHEQKISTAKRSRYEATTKRVS